MHYVPEESAVAAETSTKFRLSLCESEEDLSSSVNQQTSEVNSDRGTLDFSFITHLSFALTMSH